MQCVVVHLGCLAAWLKGPCDPQRVICAHAGHIYKMAQAVKEGVDSVEGAEGVLYQVCHLPPAGGSRQAGRQAACVNMSQGLGLSHT